MNQAVAAAVVLVSLHVNTLSGSRLGGSRVFIMAVGNGVPIRGGGDEGSEWRPE